MSPADSLDMAITPASASATAQAKLDTDREMAVTKKSNDIQKDQAQALVRLIKAAPMPPHVGNLINAVA